MEKMNDLDKTEKTDNIKKMDKIGKMDKKAKSLISLAQKAGFVVSGEENCETSLRNGTARLVIISEDASENTKKKFLNKAFYYKVKTIVYGSRQDLSSAINKVNRPTIIITDDNFASKILSVAEPGVI